MAGEALRQIRWQIARMLRCARVVAANYFGGARGFPIFRMSWSLVEKCKVAKSARNFEPFVFHLHKKNRKWFRRSWIKVAKKKKTSSSHTACFYSKIKHLRSVIFHISQEVISYSSATTPSFTRVGITIKPKIEPLSPSIHRSKGELVSLWRALGCFTSMKPGIPPWNKNPSRKKMSQQSTQLSKYLPPPIIVIAFIILRSKKKNLTIPEFLKSWISQWISQDMNVPELWTTTKNRINESTVKWCTLSTSAVCVIISESSWWILCYLEVVSMVSGSIHCFSPLFLLHLRESLLLRVAKKYTATNSNLIY